MTARTECTAKLKPKLPKSWKFIDTERGVDRLRTPALMLRQRDVVPAGNYQGSRVTTLVLTLISPTTSPETWEDDLDGYLTELLAILDGVGEWLLWTKASKKVWQESNPAYDVDIQVITNL